MYTYRAYPQLLPPMYAEQTRIGVSVSMDDDDDDDDDDEAHHHARMQAPQERSRPGSARGLEGMSNVVR
jgi:hypothetical protein